MKVTPVHRVEILSKNVGLKVRFIETLSEKTGENVELQSFLHY